MNTKPTKKAKRWKPAPFKTSLPLGIFRPGISRPDFALAISTIITAWPHVEEHIMQVFADLVGLTPNNLNPIRQLYRSIASAQIRIKIMKNMLEHGQNNRNRSEIYDHIIDEFYKLNDLRNKYAHGLWTQHSSKDVFLSEYSLSDHWLFEARKIDIRELHEVIGRIRSLEQKLQKLAHRNAATFAKANAIQKPHPQYPEQRGEGSQ